MYVLWAFFLFCSVAGFPGSAHAVIPPDFIFSVGMQAAQLFSLMTILFTAMFGAFFQFIRVQYDTLPFRRMLFVGGILSIVAVSFISSYLYAVYAQKAEYQKWLEDSRWYATGLDMTNVSVDENDQLRIGSVHNIDTSTSSTAFVSNIEAADESARFINDYFEYVARGDFERAYQMTEKAVSASAFKDWFHSVTKITLDKIQRIDREKTSVELTVYTGTTFTRYGTLLTLAFKEMVPASIVKSEVKVLARGSIENSIVSVDEKAADEEYRFFTEHEGTDIIITNEDFKQATVGRMEGYIVLDAREDIEYDNGHFTGSVHIRFADLKAGRWIELPKDTTVYVICWSGIRGKEVAEFLRTKKVVASYLENGASGWVQSGGAWSGGINFAEQYSSPRYQAVLSTDEVRNKVDESVVLVDSREPFNYSQSHIAGSVSIPIMYTPTLELESAFGQVPPGSTVIVVCDGYVNCFDAKVTGVELERRGHQFLGRYVTPWEYGE